MTNIFFFVLSLFLLPSLGISGTLKETLHTEAASGQVSFSYDTARVKLFNEIYLKKDLNGYYIEGVYCQDKHYAFEGQHPNGKLPDHTELNTEHTWPQSKFSTRYSKNIQKSDLHHLFPSASRINSERGNLPFAEVNSGKDLSCNKSHLGRAVNGASGTFFEPPHEHRGNVARAMFYFSVRYEISIDPVQEHYLREWNKEDPVDGEERTRHELISKLQGNKNPFIENPEYVDQIEDF